MALLVMFGMYFPYQKILLFFVIPVEMRFAIPGIAVLSVYLGLSGNGGNIDHFGHLGGIFAGLIYYLNEYRIDNSIGDIAYFFQSRFGKKPSNVYDFPKKKLPVTPTLEQKVDSILKKVSKSGLDSLTNEEKIVLQKHSEELQKRS